MTVQQVKLSYIQLFTEIFITLFFRIGLRFFYDFID